MTIKRVNALVRRYEILTFDLELPDDVAYEDVFKRVIKAGCAGEESGRRIERCFPDSIEYPYKGEYIREDTKWYED
jgi:hypothetical protein